MKLLYNFASRSRPERFFATLDNIINMSVTTDYIILCKLDIDDESMHNEEIMRLVNARGEKVIVKWGESKSKIDAINRDIPLDGFEIICNISDDMQFTKHGFDLDILNAIEPDCFLHLPDNYAGERVCTMTIIDNVYYQRDKRIYHPAYYSMWCDDEATEIAKARGRYKFVNLPIIRHDHYSNGGASKDALYRRNDTYNQDKLIYEQRKAAGFPA